MESLSSLLEILFFWYILFPSLFNIFLVGPIAKTIAAAITTIVCLTKPEKKVVKTNEKPNSTEYTECTYYKITKLPYYAVRLDSGRYGEYLIFTHLKHLEASGSKFLFNLYVPKVGGGTAEIDVLMICSKGIFVFESKNHSGWIFGREDQTDWCQVLPAGRGKSHKEYFYNPVMQNNSHIRHLKSFLGEQVPMWSVIAFSDRCTLQDIRVESRDVRVINRYKVASIVKEICNQIPDTLSENHISEIYTKLYPFTQVQNAVKTRHVTNIRNEQTSLHVQLPDPSDTGEYCRNCGKRVSATDRFCGSCGFKLK